jgi:RING finger protein 113A
MTNALGLNPVRVLYRDDGRKSLSFIIPIIMADEAVGVAADVPQFAFKKRSAKTKSSFRKKAPSPPRASASASSSESTSDDEDDGERRRAKRRRKNATVTASSASLPIRRENASAPADAAAAPLISTNDATKHSNWHDESKDDEWSAKNLGGTTGARPSAPQSSASDGTYKGVANYQSFIQKNPNAPVRQVGPMKAPTNIRTITVTDYVPDVCKDYKQTGFCGFGDSCKFLHAREDYKQGWELDRDWEISAKGKKLTGQTMASRNKDAAGDEEDEEDDEALLESIPFACIICKKPYTNPIVTKCGHYFCESCTLQRYRKSPACAACGAGTGGVFNMAKKLNQLLEKKRERVRKRREQAIAAGEEVSSEDEGGAGSE